MFYQKLKPYLDKSVYVRQLDEMISSGKQVLCQNLNLTTKALFLSRIYANHIQPSGRHLLFITSDCNRAEEYYEDLVLLLGNDAVAFLPDYETMPYEDRSPHYSIRAQRIEALERAIGNQPVVLVISLKSLLRKIVSPRVLEKSVLILGKDSEIELDVLCSKLLSFGYQMETEVTKVGDISRRGGILDIYSPAQKQPVRFEFFGDVIESCRFFNPLTQRSTNEIETTVKIIPAREVSLDDISSNVKSQWEKIHNKGVYEGIEQDVSLLYDDTAIILDYLNLYTGQPNKQVLIDNQLSNNERYRTFTVFDEYPILLSNAQDLFQETEELYQKRVKEISSLKKTKRERGGSNDDVALIPEPRMLFAKFEEVIEKIDNQWYFSSMQQETAFSYPSFSKTCNVEIPSLPSPFSPQTAINRDVLLLQDIIEKRLQNKWKIFIQSDNKSQSNRMREMLGEYAGQVELVIGVLHRGFDLPDAKLSVYTDHEIFNRYKQKKYQEYFPVGEALIDYDSLQPGDYIVHIEHGIGIFEGLKLMKVVNSNIECLVIRYADEGRVYVPTFQLKLVTRYVSEDGIVPDIHKLGGKRWEQLKNRTKKQIELIADDLVKLYAERSVRQGISFDSDTVWQTEMEESFIYEDTPDQKKATEDIKADMELDKPMERLLCGDVGFGKTEVAIRAAFKAVTAGWQVAVLVPTTLLAEQHFLVFRERLAQYPVNIAMFSRFRTSAQINKDLLQVKQGKIDIAIGTHRLLSKDVIFNKLGLLIIDEEHRFGVRHKEKMRKLKSNVDTLYMSATPIPRTLNMALVKLKEMSLMQTSPKARLPIRTGIIPYDINIISDAIKREMDRGGQIIFVHNRIATIDSIADELRQGFPKAKISVGHGQLPEKALENIMLDFYDHKFDILVATTIIESGIDVPNANTIFINRADMFGLAQLYQIRGRVGRSNRRAYAYLIIPKHLQEMARRRLEALSEYNALGSGYQIAMRDLELRGAGSLLGTKQSGIINSIGFNYYNRLLSEAIENIVKGEAVIWSDEKSDYLEKVRIDADFFFPVSYIKDEKTRLDFYSRMISFKCLEDFDELSRELTDRFGVIPNPARRGLMYYKLRMLADRSKLKSFRIDKNKIIIQYDKKILPSKNQLQQVFNATEHLIEFDNTKDSLRMTITLPEAGDKEKELILNEAQKVLLVIVSWNDE